MDVEGGLDSEGYAAFWWVNEIWFCRVLVVYFGFVDGCVVVGDVLSWVWEYWSDVWSMVNLVGYFYWVGQTVVCKH